MNKTTLENWEDRFDEIYCDGDNGFKTYYVEGGYLQPEDVKHFIKDLLSSSQKDKEKAVEEAVNEILEAEYVINHKTCPGGDTSRANEAPSQVVGTIHMSLARYNKIKSLKSKKE